MSTYTKETYSEICEFLGLIGNKYVNKIPGKLLQLFEENKSNDYVPHINPSIPIKEQSLNEDTLAIIALLNLKYWCDDEDEISRLKEIYKSNERIYQEKLKEQFNYDNIFKDKQNKYEKTNTTDMIEYRTIPIYKRCINWIKRKLQLFH